MDRPAQASPVARNPGDVASHMLATMVGNFFPPLAMLATAPILAHGLGVDGRGAIAAANAPLILVTTVATFGIPQAATYLIARSPSTIRRVMRVSTLLTVLTGIACTAAVILGANWLSGGDHSITKLIVISALAILPTLLVGGVIRGVASGLHQWRAVAGERLISSVVRLVGLVVLLVVHQLTPMSATIVLAVAPLLGIVAYGDVVRSYRERFEDVTVEGTSMREMMSYGTRSWVGAVSGILLYRLDQTIMVPLSDSYQLGLYAIAATVADIPLIINAAVRDVTFSADAAQSEDARLGKSARISSTASAVLGLFTGVTMIWWLPWLFGAEFRPAINATAVLIAASVLGTPGSIAGAGLAARGRPGLRSTSLVVACLINLALLVILVPKYGAMGAAIATLVGSLIAANSNIVFLKWLYGVPFREFHGFRRTDWDTVVNFTKRTLSALRGGSSVPTRR